jgi:flagellar basal body rod protein FlgC
MARGWVITMLAVINFEANIKMLKAASEMTKSVLDMKT